MALQPLKDARPPDQKTLERIFPASSLYFVYFGLESSYFPGLAGQTSSADRRPLIDCPTTDDMPDTQTAE